MTTMTRGQVLEAREAGRPANLRGVNLAGVDLHDTDLRGTNLTHANLHGADLTDAGLAYANLYDVDLAHANLTYAWLDSAYLTTRQLLDTRGLKPGGHGLPHATWDDLLPTNPEQRQLVEHLLNDDWEGTLREAIATAEGLAGR